MPYTLPSIAVVDPGKTGGLGLNLRDAPARSGRRIGTMPDQTRLDVVGVAREAYSPDAAALWYQVRYGRYVGFCAADFLSLDADPIAPLPLAATVDPIRTGGLGLNLRESPAQSGRWLTTMRDNSPLQIVGAVRAGFAPGAALWFHVQFGAQRGYCASDFVAVSSSPGGVIVPSAGPFVGAWPANFHERVVTAPIDQPRSYGLHEGVDLRAPDGTPVIAWADGVVDKIFTWDRTLWEQTRDSKQAYGNYVRLKHAQLSLLSMYCHLQSFNVQKDDVVQMGEQIGLADNTGNSDAAHLHFMLIDPINGLDGYVYPKIINPTPRLPKPYTVL